MLAAVVVLASPGPGFSPSPAQDLPLRGGQDTSKTKPPTPLFDQFGRPIPPPADTTRQDTTRRDTTRRDTIGAQRKLIFGDTTYVVCLDSTARLRQFTYERHDPPVVDLFPHRTYPLFASPRQTLFRREISIDSTGDNVVIRETVDGTDVKLPVSVPLGEYLRQRLRREIRAGLAQQVQQPKVITQKDDLGQLLSNITQITIPIPANPIFSIFGKQEIKLNISGAVDIKAGLRNTTSDQTTISRLDQTRNEPDFSQEVQVNVSGTIGDKLNILADWNTRRTFEYENQLKIKYTPPLTRS